MKNLFIGQVMKTRPVAVAVLILLLTFAFSIEASSAEKPGPKGAKPTQPPAVVALGSVTSGHIAPKTEFVGTLYYREVSEVAAEVSGKVEKLSFEEGDKVEAGAVLVNLDTGLLEKRVESTKAVYEQIVNDLERATKDFKRIEGLYIEEFVSEQDYDEAKFRVLGLDKRAASLKAEFEGLSVELGKKTIRAPFKGVVISRDVDRGEWLSPGKSVATVARVDVIDLRVDVPEAVMRSVKKGAKVKVKAGGRTLSGKVYAIIPRGDVKTRTFPIKIRMGNNAQLAEGMDARVSLPTASPKKALIVNRDALMTKFGRTVVFIVVDGKAKMLPVTVVGYEGKNVGVKAEGLKKGMKVITKGNERVREGQPVISGASKQKKPTGGPSK